jgi:guanylate kinase
MIEFRLANAKRDMEEARGYHYVVVNEEIEETVGKLKAIIVAERCKKKKQSILEEKMSQWEVHHGKNYSGGLSEKGGKSV